MDNVPVTPPYLDDPPAVIPIDLGRQLFVDDFLIQRTNLTRTSHAAEYHPANPIFTPEAEWERHDPYADRTKTRPRPTAMPFSDGVFFDPHDRLFKMWYMGGYQSYTCLATSEDGIKWKRPVLDVVPGTNIVSRQDRDSSTVWLDLFDRDPQKRYKMAQATQDPDHPQRLYLSADGVHWKQIGLSGGAGDRTTFFFNPFRRVWVFGVRDNEFGFYGRYRRYWEHADFAAANKWGGEPSVPWVKADSGDLSRTDLASTPELYNLDCVGYESLMLGLFTIWRGESNIREKINEVTVGFSRDGFHWSRPERRTFMGVSERENSWNWCNVQSAGGCCLIVGDKLYFYVSARQGVPGTQDPGVCTTGLAMLRRDGFASMDWRPEAERIRRPADSATGAGELVTRPVRFSGRFPFVNADTQDGELRIELLDETGRVLAPFTAANCVPIREDGTRVPVRWTQATDLSSLAGRSVRFRFLLTRGSLFSFWVSRWTSGESLGYPAAGGPAFRGPVDSPDGTLQG